MLKLLSITAVILFVTSTCVAQDKRVVELTSREQRIWNDIDQVGKDLEKQEKLHRETVDKFQQYLKDTYTPKEKGNWSIDFTTDHRYAILSNWKSAVPTSAIPFNCWSGVSGTIDCSQGNIK